MLSSWSPLRGGVRHATFAVLALGTALATSPARAATPAVDPGELAWAMSSPWPALQRPDGTFPDYVRDVSPGALRDGYGTAMLGYGLLQEGLRSGRRPFVDAGLRAVTSAAEHPTPTIFENLALAGAYDLAEHQLADDAGYRRDRAAWQHRLRELRLTLLGTHAAYYNWFLVEALGVVELDESKLRSGARGTILAERRRARGLARDVIGSALPAVAAGYARTDSRAGRTTVLSDPPWNPLAYHAFTVGLLARAIELLGPSSPRGSPEMLREALRASWLLAAPDGDLSYIGRSQEQSWTLAMTAYAARVAMRLPGTQPADAAAFAGLAERSLERLRGVYLGGPFGLWITPALRADRNAGVAGLDPYAAAVSYTGLTVVALEWMLEQPAPPTDGSVAADTPGASILGRGPGAFAAVRTANLWFAVKEGPGVVAEHRYAHAVDLRYDAGLAALKEQGADGSWRDVMPLRPHTTHAGESAGPRLLTGGGAGRLFGERLHVSARATVVLSGGFRTPAGRWLRRGVTVRYEPTACGVRVVIPAAARKRYEYTAFLRPRHGAQVSSEAGEVGDDEQTVTFDRAAKVKLVDGYSSDVDPRLVRARLAFPAGPARDLTVTICATGR